MEFPYCLRCTYKGQTSNLCRQDGNYIYYSSYLTFIQNIVSVFIILCKFQSWKILYRCIYPPIFHELPLNPVQAGGGWCSLAQVTWREAEIHPGPSPVILYRYMTYFAYAWRRMNGLIYFNHSVLHIISLLCGVICYFSGLFYRFR